MKLDKKSIEDILFLTPMQEGMLFHYLKDPGSDYYFEQLSLEISGKIDKDIFEKAWNFVIETNEMLRAVFRWEKVENPVQIILKEHSLQPRYYDFSDRVSHEIQKHLEQVKVKDREEKFNLHEVPWRVTLCKIGEDRYEMIISNHHILYDGWSNGIILKEFFKAYHTLCKGERLIKPPVKTPFKKFIEWTQNQDKNKQQHFWQEYLTGLESTTELPIKGRRGEVKSIESVSLILAEDIKDKLDVFVNNNRVTLATVFYTVWGILLQKYCGSEDVIFGTTVSGRSTGVKGIENMVGLFINTIPLRVQSTPDVKIIDVLPGIENLLWEREEFENTSLVDIGSYSTGGGTETLFDTIVAIENYPLDNRLIPVGSLLSVHSYSMAETTHYDLTVGIMLFNEIEIKFSYRRELFEKETIENLSRHFKGILRNIIGNPGAEVSRLEIISTEEKKRILYEFNDTAAEYPKGNSLHGLFAQQVERTPDNIAVIGKAKSAEHKAPCAMRHAFTYRELNEKSARLESTLIEKGVLADNIVGIMMERSIEMIIGIMGILKAGGAYLPIDPAYPQERINYMVKDSKPIVVLTASKIEESKNRSSVYSVASVVKNSLAYIIYTSGSTGRPKGVMVDQNAIINLLFALQQRYPLGERDTYLLKTSYLFDVSVTELFGWFLEGGRLAILEPGGEKEPKAILDFIAREGVTHINFVPSMFHAFVEILDSREIAKVSSLKYIFLAGEALLAGPVNRFRSLNRSIAIENIYGPTEAAVYAGWYSLAEWDGKSPIPIGKPLPNVKLYILDKWGCLQPIAVPGELCIGGVGLARGYLNQPELTIERFLTTEDTEDTEFNKKFLEVSEGAGSPSLLEFTRRVPPLTLITNTNTNTHKLKVLTHHSTLYQTGDLARWLPNGNIEFLGRMDYQVKIRGIRVELGEIESQLMNHEDIKEAVVLTREIPGGENHLCAFIITGRNFAVSELKTYLTGKLPGYMIPSYFKRIEKLPLTPNGKVDRKALMTSLAASDLQTGVDYIPPKSEVEKNIAEIWKELLKAEKIGIHDNFFDLGGNSLSIIRLNSRLKKAFKKDIPMAAMFTYPTISTMAAHLSGSDKDENKDKDKAEPKIGWDTGKKGSDIAVIGMSCRFPGAKNIHEFWENLKNGIESIAFFAHEELIDLGIETEVMKDRHYVPAKGILMDKEYFDASFFDYTPAEAEIMDPQMRLFHEICWEGLEDAGYDPGTYDGLIGLYAGASSNPLWEILPLSSNPDYSELWGAMQLSDKDYTSTRVGYKMGFRGPCITLKTACSTSLAAVDLACQGLSNRACHMALAGGVSITMNDEPGYRYREGAIMSRDGHCRSFDARATGTLGGNGAGAVVLKFLDDAIRDRDHIYAVIKSSAVNNDGKNKVGFTAPGVEGQANVIRAAIQKAGVDPGSIGYIETHGTGTVLGDTIEIEGLKQAFTPLPSSYTPDNVQPKAHKVMKSFDRTFSKVWPPAGPAEAAAIGSVKSNIGHLDAAAGIAGFIKTVLALKHGLIPPSLHFETINPEIDLRNTPFYINTRLIEWKSSGIPRRGGVSSFGIGGTNAHVILEEAPEGTGGLAPLPDTHHPGDYQLILLSAKTQSALDKMTENLTAYLRNNLLNPGNHVNPTNPGQTLADAAYTLQVGRKPFKFRKMFVCSSIAEAVEELSSPDKGKVRGFRSGIDTPPVIFMFPGLGSQYANMGLDLYQTEQIFREEMNRCFDILNPLVDFNIKEILYPGPSVNEGREEEKVPSPNCSEDSHHSAFNINHFEVAQAAVFITQYALTKLLMNWGIKPQAMIGYSFGEYTSACISGVFSLENALKLIVCRGKLIRELSPGLMLSVPLTKEEIGPLLSNELSIAIDNGPSCIVAGSSEGVETFEEQMKDKRILCMRLKTSHALHSKMVEPIIEKFNETVGKITLNTPQVPYISNVTGNWATEEEVKEPGYWVNHLRQTVQFAQGIKKLIAQPHSIFIEIGPGRDLCAMVQKYIDNKSDQHVLNLIRHPEKDISDVKFLLTKMGRLWLYGTKVDWMRVNAKEKRHRIPLPTYPFEHQPFTVNPFRIAADMLSLGKFLPDRKSDQANWFYIPTWKRSRWVGIGHWHNMEPYPWLVLCDEYGLGLKLVEELEKKGKETIIVRTGIEFRKVNRRAYIINPEKNYDYQSLFQELKKEERKPGGIIHLWGITKEEKWDLKCIDKALNLYFYSVLKTAQEIEKLENANDIKFMVVTNNMQEVIGEDRLSPLKALVLGAVKGIPKEYENIKLRSIDVILPGSGSSREQKLIRQLLKEFITETIQPVVAIRDNHRWVQIFEHEHLETPEEKTSPLKKEGVYLVTGGLGGIGFELARYLAKQVSPKLVLTGRLSFPSRERWSQWLIDHGEEDKISRRIRKVQELETLGAEVSVFAADVADLEQMQYLVKRTGEQFGQINGIIHAAGIPDGTLLQLRTREISEKVLSPKVRGVLVLNTIFENMKLDFFILCSSVASIMPPPGQIAYCASNNFLDAFAKYKAYMGDTCTLSINWPRWKGVGMAIIGDKLDKNLGGEAVKGGISPEEGVGVFSHLLADIQPQVVVSEIDLGNLMEKDLENAKASSYRKEFEETEVSTKTNITRRPDIDTEYAAPRNKIEQVLADTWSKFFGFEPVGIHDDFFELGGDSLKALILLPRIHKELAVVIPLTEFFTLLTIEKLAEYINHAGKSAFSEIVPVEKKEFYLLSSAQRRLYFLHQMDENSTAYNISQVMALAGELEIPRLQEGFKKLIKRHESLRTSINEINEVPAQRIYNDVEFNIEYYNELQTEYKRGNGTGFNYPEKIIENFICPFDLSKSPLFRVGLIEQEEQKNILMVDMHHIISDGISMNILAKDFMALYREEDLPDLRVQYKDFSEWQKGKQQKEKIKRQEAFWLKEFDDEITVLNLPMDYERPLVKNFEGKSVSFEIGGEETSALKSLAQQQETTLFMVLLSIYTIFLSKLAGQEDIVVGTPIAGRRHSDLESLIGMFVNTLVLRNFPVWEKTFAGFLDEIKENTIKAFENQDYLYEDLVDRVEVERDTGRNPLFDAIFALQNMDAPVLQIPGLKLTPYHYESRAAKFDITLNALEKEDRLDFTFEYCTRLFKEETIRRFIGYFTKTVSTVIHSPGMRISEIEIIDEEEKNRILRVFNDTAADYPKDKTIHGLFEEQVERRPYQVALVGPKLQIRTVQPVQPVRPVQLTYRQLNEESDRLAGLLIEKGVRPDIIVGIMIERSVEMIIGILGILKSHGAYLSIDPEYPQERIDYMLKDSSAKILLIGQEIAGLSSPQALNNRPKGTNSINNYQLTINNLQLEQASLAYIIYTSGTTGQPKGTLISHRNVVRLMFNDKFPFDFSGRDVWTLFHSFCFDFSVWEMYGALLYGGKSVIVPKMIARDTTEFLGLINKENVTVLNQTPSAFYNLINEALNRHRREKNLKLYIKYVIFGGEALNPSKLKDWQAEYPQTRLINMFGITETTVHVTFKEINEKDIELNIGNIGKPIPTLNVYILDRYLNPVPIGVTGEICVGGDGVCRGYLNRQELIQGKFIENPFKPGDRLYRSGDMGRHLENGDMEYSGRIDQQVKIRGYRIELGEIENRLLKYEGIKDAVVLAEETPGEKYLCAYIAAHKEFTITGMRGYLSGKLPGYMIPSYFVRLERIPLTLNGKIDKKALPGVYGNDEGLEESASPTTETEERLAELWENILGIKPGINADFFHSGGDSIKAVRLVDSINTKLSAHLKIADIYLNGTVKKLASIIERDKTVYEYTGEQLSSALAEIEGLRNRVMSDTRLPGGIEDVYPMSDIQKGMVFHSLKERESALYHDQMVYQPVIKDFNPGLLKKAFVLLVEKHPILRTVFDLNAYEEPVQLVYRQIPYDMEHEDISPLKKGEQEEYLLRYLAEDRRKTFKFDKPPLWRLRTFDLGNDHICVVLVAHHAILDGWSVASLDTELINTYWQLLSDPAYTPGILKNSYKAFIIEQSLEKKRVDAEDFWRNELEGYKRLELPNLLQNDERRDRVETHRYKLGNELHWKLKNIAKIHHSTVKNLCFSAYIYMMNMLSYDSEIVVGLVTNNRPVCEDGDKILGCFLNTIPVRIIIPASLSWLDYMKLVDRKLLELKKYERKPLFDIVRIIGENTQDRNPIFDVIFNFIDFHVLDQIQRDYGKDQTGKLQVEEKVTTNTVFDFSVSGTQGEFELSISYSGTLFNERTVANLCHYFEGVLNKFIADPRGIVNKIGLIPGEEKHKLLYEFNETGAEYPGDKTIHRLFEEQVERRPNQVALVGALRAGVDAFGESPLNHSPLTRPTTYYSPVRLVQLTYRELNEQSNRLAGLLIEKGTGPDTIVGIMVERSVEMIAGIMGILKSRGAYLPIDPEYPQERINYMLEDSGAKILLTGLEIAGLFSPQALNNRPKGANSINNYQLTINNLQLEQASLAYIIYTSGTTGKPKGVAVNHKNLVNYVTWFSAAARLTGEDKTVLTSSFAFDLGYTSLYPSIIRGGRLHILAKDVYMSAGRLLDYIRYHKITYLKITPSLFTTLVADTHFTAETFRVRLVILGGEAINTTDVETAFRVYPPLDIMNHYGPTEATIGCIAQLINREHLEGYKATPTIGHPIFNARVFILDKYLKLQPVGQAGELCLGGAGLARGYLNRPGLTAERFVISHLSLVSGAGTETRPYILKNIDPKLFCRGDSPGSPHRLYHSPFTIHHSPIYKTGDLARWLQDGNIEFLGRIDHQVKIRGYRIELGEIESRLSNHPGIKEAVVLAREDEAGDKYLCAYVVSEERIIVSKIRENLSKKLPDYMIPSYFVQLERIPLTPNGKINRRALPKPELKASGHDVPPRDKTEEKLAALWSEVLNIKKELIGIDSNFFQLGGHSLKATALAAKIHKLFDVNVPLAEIFKTPRIRELAEFIKGKVSRELFISIKSVEEKEYYSVSPAQKRLYILQQMVMENISYNMPSVIPLPGNIEKEKLESMLERLIKRHDSLRTSFITINEEPVQKIHREVNFSIGRYEIAEDLEADRLIHNFAMPFDLSQAPLLRAILLTRETGERVLFIDTHHIITDGASREILEKEFKALYTGEELPLPRNQYKDYSEWQKNGSQDDVSKEQETYWLSIFAGEIPALDLPTDNPRPVIQDFEGSTVEFTLTQEENQALKNLAKEKDVTLYMLVLSVYTILLSKLSGQEDIVVGTAISGRRHPDLEKIVGMFVNTLALRNKPYGEMKYKEYLEELKKVTWGAYENQEYPFEELVDKIMTGRDPDRNPVFDVMYNYLNRGDNPQEKHTPAVDEPVSYKHRKGISKFDLTLGAADYGDGERLVFTFEYCTKLFNPGTIEGFIGYFKKILNMLLENPGQELRQLEIISEREKYQVLYDFNDTAAAYPREKILHELFEEQVERWPNQVALVGPKLQITNEEVPFGQVLNAFGGEAVPDVGAALRGCPVPDDGPVRPVRPVQLTYRQLNEESNRLAGLLIEKGIKSDTIVGVMIERSVEMVIGILAILKSGGAYMPVDPGYPRERIDYMLKDSAVKILLTSLNLSEKFEKLSIVNCQLLMVNEMLPNRRRLNNPPKEANSINNYQLTINNSQLKDKSLAYIIYTSGTTGRPKGVLVQHQGVVNMIWNHRNVFGENAGSRISQVANPAFDAVVFETWPCLSAGAVLCMADNETCMNPQRMKTWLIKNQITISFQSTSMAQRLLEEQWPKTGISLKVIRTAGDRLTCYPSHPYPFLFYNLYGPTEDTVWTTWTGVPVIPIEQQKLRQPPIGKPVGNKQVYILDHNMKMQPVGVRGELGISGSGLARGYLNSPELTAEKFDHDLLDYQDYQDEKKNYKIQNTNGRRRQVIYKTGDLARWLFDGNIEFLGRIDNQVKIRGFRIELGEIEKCLLKFSGVKEVLVLEREEGENKYLCAYVVSDGKNVISGLREYLSKELPEYMMPSYFVQIEKIPLTPNGKIDRKALPGPDIKKSDEYEAPRDEIEKKLVDIWSGVLGIEKEKIGINDNFFHLGGHSLKAYLLVTKIIKEFNVKVLLSDVFRLPTVSLQANYFETAAPKKFTSIKMVEKKEYYTVSSAQRRMYILQQLHLNNIGYNMPIVLVMEGKLYKDKIEGTFFHLLKRHNNFRTSFVLENDEVVQRIYDEVDFRIDYYETACEAEIKEMVNGFTRPFSLDKVPLLRGGLIKLNENRHIFMLDMHHIISDGVSMNILVRDYMALYSGEKLPGLKLQYKDYSEWQNSGQTKKSIKKQEEYWLKHFKGEIPVLKLSTDYLRPRDQSFEGNSIYFEMGIERTDIVKKLALDAGVTLYIFMLAVYNILLAKISGQKDIIVGAPTAGRKYEDFLQIIGLFVNILALRNYVDEQKTFREFLEEVKINTLNAFDNQEYPFEELVNKLKVKRHPGNNPLFDVVFLLENYETRSGDIQELAIPGLELKPYRQGNQVAKYDLLFYLFEGNNIQMKLEYCTKLFKQETIIILKEYIMKIIDAVLENSRLKLSEIDIISQDMNKEIEYQFVDDLENE